MKVAHIVCAFPPYKGGMGNSAYHFSRILAELGYEITVFTPDYSANSVCSSLFFLKSKRILGAYCGPEEITKGNSAQLSEKIKVERLRPFASYGNAAILPQLLWKLRHFDIIHLHYPFYGAAVFALLGKIIAGKKTKLIIHYHMDTVAGGLKGFIFKLARLFILPILARFSKVITCASLDYIKHSDLANFYRKYPEKFRQTLFGVDLEKFKPPQAVMPRREKIILFVGGLDRQHYFKGLENLFLAFRETVKFIPDCSLFVVGEGDLRFRYEELAWNLGIKGKVNFRGAVPNGELPDYYRECDCFVLPSVNKGEAFGLVLLEAMASGRPVIASDLPGVRSIFKNNMEGILVEPNNIDDLAAKLKKILTNGELAEKMGQAARALMENKYSWEKVGKRLDFIYHYAKYTPK